MKKFLSIALVLVMLVALCGCDASDYKKAMKAYDNGEYADARDMFEALDDYKDSKSLVKDCNYRLAKKAMDKEDFDKALSILEKLDDYKDSDDMIEECSYYLGLEKLEKGKFEEAAKYFEEAGSYKDSEDQLLECSYQQALAAMADGDTEAAEKLLAALNGYKDAADLLNALTTPVVGPIDGPVVNGSGNELTGYWTASVDISDLLLQVLMDDDGTDGLKKHYVGNPIYLDFELEIDEYDYYYLTYDCFAAMDLIEANLDPYIDATYAYLGDAMEEECAAEGITLDALLQEYDVKNIEELAIILLGEDVDTFLYDIIEDFFWYNDFTMGELTLNNGKITVDDWYDNVNSMVLSGKNLIVDFDLDGYPFGAVNFTRK